MENSTKKNKQKFETAYSVGVTDPVDASGSFRDLFLGRPMDEGCGGGSRFGEDERKLGTTGSRYGPVF